MHTTYPLTAAQRARLDRKKNAIIVAQHTLNVRKRALVDEYEQILAAHDVADGTPVQVVDVTSEGLVVILPDLPKPGVP